MARKNWIKFGLLVLLGLCLSWCVSCSPSTNSADSAANSASPGTQEVEFWTMQLSDFSEYFNQLIATFETENPTIKVRWVDVPWADMQSKILTAVSAKTAPDVVNLNPDFAAQLAGRDAWLDLDDKVAAADQQQYLPKIWQANMLNGKSFGLPWYLTTSVTIHNTELLKQAGVTQPPATYAELANVARQVKAATGKYAYFVTFVPEDSAEVLQSFVKMGVTLVNNEGQAAFNTPQGRAVFHYWTDLYQQDLLPKEVLTQGHRRAIELYQMGETAILSSGAEFLNSIATNAPAIAQVSASAPQISGATGKTSVAVMNLVIPRDTDQPEAALKWALFVTNNTNQLAFAKLANVLPSTTAALKDQHFTQLPSHASPVEQARAVSANQIPAAEVLLPQIPEVKQLQKILYDNLQAAMLDEKTVDQAIADAASEWDDR